MKAFLRTFFASLLSMILILMVVSSWAYYELTKEVQIEDHSHLVVDVYGDILEYSPPGDLVSELLGDGPETLQRILGNLEKAAVDDRIDGVIVNISSSNGAGMAMLEEMRVAIKRVRAAGKKVYGFCDSMDRHSFFLASACDSVYAPPTAYIGFTGSSVTSTHVKGTLEKLGIKDNIHKIKDYKSAAELVTRKNLSPEAREMYQWLLDEMWEMYVEAVSADRGLSESDIMQLMEHALFTPEEAMEAGLVDRLLYWDELEGMLKQDDDDHLRTVSQSRYAGVEPEVLGLKGKKKIAVVHAEGSIGGRKSRIDPLLGLVMGHESVASDLRRALDDEDVAAIVFRVNSPGGDGLTSDLISHEVSVVAREKPVVVSMVDVAGSGGYMISYRATKILADPMTLTGSIGSISGKFNIKGFHDKLGITHDSVTRGPRALLWSSYRDFTDEEWKRFRESHWAGFNRWLRDVAEYRGMAFEEAEKLAHGRVWTGRQGEENGLIDGLGGLDRAIALAKELAEIPAEDQVTVVHYPEEEDILDMILGDNGGIAAAARLIVYRFLREEVAETWAMLTQRTAYMMEDVRIR